MATRRIRKTGTAAISQIDRQITRLKARQEVEKKRQEFLEAQDGYRKLRGTR